MASSIPVSVPADAAGLEAARGGRVARRTRQLVAAGAAFVALLTIMAVAAPWLAPHDPVRQSLRERLTAPTLEAADGRAHPLGTDHLGRDVLSRTIWGARVSLLVGFAAVMVGGLVGAGLGILAGYRGGWTDYARVLRSQVLVLRSREFVDAILALGGAVPRIVARHILPNVLSTLVVIATLQLARAIVLEETLSFLGLGIQPPTPSWGGMIQEGRDYLDSAWWISTSPGVVLMITSIVISRAGDWLRDVLDPTLRGE